MITTLIPLGTASATPTRERHLPATAVERKGRLLLFDCGEGTQFQFLRAGLKRSRVDAVFISHLHGDHLYGLFGMLTTMEHLGRETPMSLIAPERLETVLPEIPGLEEELSYEVEFVGLRPGMRGELVHETDEIRVTASELDHRVVSFGFRLEEKMRPGRLDPERARELGADPAEHFSMLKRGVPVELGDGRIIQPGEVLGPDRPGVTIAYISDTRPCDAAVALARDADLLYHEATFGEELSERADETGHSTAQGAARIADEAGARKLLLSHFSARYSDPASLVSEAQSICPNTEAAEELKRYALDPRIKWADA